MDVESKDKSKLLDESPQLLINRSRPFSAFLYPVTILLLFSVVVFVPITWYLHCRPYQEVHSVMIQFREFAYPTLLPEDNIYYYEDVAKERGKENSKSWLDLFFYRNDDGNNSTMTTTPAIEFRPTTATVPRAEDEYSSFTNRIRGIKGTQDENSECQIDNNFRFDCHPEAGASQDKCEARGCCWATPTADIKLQKRPRATLDVPWCFYPTNFPSYFLVNQTKTKNGLLAFFARNGSSYYPNDVHLVRFDFSFLGPNVWRVKFSDAENLRYEVPYPKIQASESDYINDDYEVVVKDPIDITIVQKSTGRKFFDMLPNSFIFTDQFIQISQMLPSEYVYGLGERRDNFLRSVHWQQFTMFAADQAPRDNSNLYGSQPFLLTMSKTGDGVVGLMLLNSNGLDVILQPAPAVTFRAIGGVLDFYIFPGNSPGEVVSSYTKAIGLPILPPYWSLGFHLCRFGYNSDNRTRQIWEQTRRAGIPFDVQWNDIDYMDKRRDFTYDKENFKGLPQLVKDIHQSGMHYVVIIDPAIDVPPVPGSYFPFDDGVKRNIFIKNSSDNLFIGKVWSEHGAVWPDFTNPETAGYWTDRLTEFHNEIPYDGLWIDMNEPANFYDGTDKGCPNSTFEDPPYLPDVNGGKLYHKTVCMTAKQNVSTHYNVHNLYGFSESIHTNIALKNITKKRPFIISRSTFIGHGHHAGHWTGDIYSTWEDMQKSIPGILDYSLFGVPMVGADICGFNGNTTTELCERWMELGAFYPFSRNHNTDDGIDQDPVSLGPGVVNASIKALNIRYLFLPYLYTLFYRATVFGETVARPLVFEFHHDPATFGIDSQFLWGSAMMILPVLKQGETMVHSYFPEGRWYIFEKFQLIQSKGTTISIDSPLDIINVAFRGGNILPMQSVKNTTTESRKEKFGLLLALDEEEKAEGELFWDDGESLDTIEEKKYNLLSFNATKGQLVSTVVNLGAPQENMTLGMITVAGINKKPTNVTVNGTMQNFNYYEDEKVLMVVNMTLPMKTQFKVLWS